MPTYQYACKACEHRFEAVQSFSDASLTECPECSGQLRKLYGSVGVVFKGSAGVLVDLVLVREQVRVDHLHFFLVFVCFLVEPVLVIELVVLVKQYH